MLTSTTTSSPDRLISCTALAQLGLRSQHYLSAAAEAASQLGKAQTRPLPINTASTSTTPSSSLSTPPSLQTLLENVPSADHGTRSTSPSLCSRTLML